MSDLLKKLNDYRMVVVALLGLAPVIADALDAVDLTNGVLVAISSGALALAGLIAAINNRPSQPKE